MLKSTLGYEKHKTVHFRRRLGDGIGMKHTGAHSKVMVMFKFLDWEISSWVFILCFIF